MRFSLSLIALVAACPSWADTIPVLTKVTEVTMHPDSAAVSRIASVQVPAGKHRLVFQGVPNSAHEQSLRIDLTGARQVGTIFRNEYTPPRDTSSPEVDAAKARLEDIKERIQSVRDDADRVRLAANAADVSLDFLKQLGENEGLADASPETLRQIAQMIQGEAMTASVTALDARIAARRVETRLMELNEELADANQALAALDLEDDDRLYIAVEIDAAAAGEVQVDLSYLVFGGTEWVPVYDLNLTTGDTPRLDIQRDAFVSQNTGENWSDVTLHLSTTEAIGATDPSYLDTTQRYIVDPQQPVRKAASSALLADSYDGAPEPSVEALVTANEETPIWSKVSGPGVTYTYHEKVSVASGADVLRLELDSLSENVTVTAHAVPLRDVTAFRMASLTNTSGEEWLSSPYAARYVDGYLVGDDSFQGLAPGQEVHIGFGPIDGLRLTRDILNRNQGDRGILSKSNQKAEQVEIKIENLTGRTWPMQVVDRVPFSEQEDLEISWTAVPRPSQENWENRRGILAWSWEIKPGEIRKIKLNTSINWPDGMVLR
ncbi:mucoidy inhibitor MuiA family protein [Rhodobacteraceae bacterium M382]|nr:mucoidy inhibitor MuiA family protein [Rhodobacteraceae bacterium M382]